MEVTGSVEVATRKFSWLAAGLSVVIPGLGHLYLGRYRRAAVWLSPLLLVGVGTVMVSQSSTSSIISAALSPTVLWSIFVLNSLAALWRIGASVDAYFVGERVRSDAMESNVLAVLGWFAIGLAIVVPHMIVGRYTVDALVLVDTVFVLEGESVPTEPVIPIGTDADIVPDPAAAETVAPELYEREPILYFEVDPEHEESNRNLIFREGIGDPDAVASWNKIVAERARTGAGAPFLPFIERVGPERITILLAGGDAGPGRGGLRTDTMMVVTLDAVTNRAAVFGFPRNLGHTPLPRKFENAFTDLQRRLAPPPPPPPPPPEDLEEGEELPPPPPPPSIVNCKCFPEQLNALYPFTRKWTKTYPNEVDPGMAALRDTLEHVMGIPIDYYVLADMAAFVDLVDAINGVDVYVQKPLEAEVSPPREGDPWAKVDVGVGWNHLDGPQALAYARARKGSSDYVRMQRQRCMVRAVAAKARPLTLLRNFSAIVDAVEGSVVTSIPLSFAPDLLSSAARLDFDDIETVGFVHGYWEAERDHLGHPVPDVGRIRSKVRSVIEGQATEVSEEVVVSECDA